MLSLCTSNAGPCNLGDVSCFRVSVEMRIA